jgi:hypothetical protein
MFYFGISKYLNFTRELWPEVRVQISKTMRCLHPITRETSEIDSKGQSTPVACFHVHGAMAAPYWPILACGTRVQVKTRYFWKIWNKYFYLSYSNETFHIKALEYKEYFTAIDLGECWRVSKTFKFFSIWTTKCLAKRWVNIQCFGFVCNVMMAFDPPFERLFYGDFNGGFRFKGG